LTYARIIISVSEAADAERGKSSKMKMAKIFVLFFIQSGCRFASKVLDGIIQIVILKAVKQSTKI